MSLIGSILRARTTGQPLPPDADDAWPVVQFNGTIEDLIAHAAALVGTEPGAWDRWTIGQPRRFRLPIGSVWTAREVCRFVEASE